MEDPNMTQVGRLAMRQEGEFWNAYYAHNHTMEGAVLIGSIRMAGIVNKPERKAAFLSMMREIVSDATEKTSGHRPVWGPEESVPEHEKSGNA